MTGVRGDISGGSLLTHSRKENGSKSVYYAKCWKRVATRARNRSGLTAVLKESTGEDWLTSQYSESSHSSM